MKLTVAVNYIRSLHGGSGGINCKEIFRFVETIVVQIYRRCHGVLSKRERQPFGPRRYPQTITPQKFWRRSGLVAGKYHIWLDKTMDPVQHPPRRVPVALRGRLQETLDVLVQQDIIAPVTEPRSGVGSTPLWPQTLLHKFLLLTSSS